MLDPTKTQQFLPYHAVLQKSTILQLCCNRPFPVPGKHQDGVSPGDVVHQVLSCDANLWPLLEWNSQCSRDRLMGEADFSGNESLILKIFYCGKDMAVSKTSRTFSASSVIEKGFCRKATPSLSIP